MLFRSREDNKRELLNLSINPTESTASWQEALKSIKKRGVSKVDLIVADGLKGLEDAVHQLFPEAKFQKCIVHKIRNILQKIRPKEKEQVACELKEVFNNFSEMSTRKDGIDQFVLFVECWKPKYSHLARQLDHTLAYYFTYIDFPVATRRIVYATNSLENLNKMIRKATKNKLSFEKPSRLLDYLFVIIKEFEENNWMKYPVTTMNEWSKDTIEQRNPFVGIAGDSGGDFIDSLICAHLLVSLFVIECVAIFFAKKGSGARLQCLAGDIFHLFAFFVKETGISE